MFDFKTYLFYFKKYILNNQIILITKNIWNKNNDKDEIIFDETLDKYSMDDNS